MSIRRNQQLVGDHIGRWASYLMALVASLMTCLVRYVLGFSLGDDPAVDLFIFPVILSSYFGGLGPGLLATVASAVLAKFFFIPPYFSFSIGSTGYSLQWIILIVSGTFISILTAMLRRSSPGEENEGEPAGSVERSVQLGFAVALAFLSIIGVVSYFSVVRLTEDAQLVAHSNEIVANLATILSNATDVDAASRGYVIAGEENFLGPYQNGAKEGVAILARLKELTADDPLQQRRLEALGSIFAERLAVAAATIEARRSPAFAVAQEVVLSGRGKELQDRIRGVVSEMSATERELLQGREGRTRRSAAVAKWVIVSGGATAITCIAFALFFIRRQLERQQKVVERRVEERTGELVRTQRSRLTERKRAEEEILRLNTNLEGRVIERTSQLQASNAELSIEIGQRKRVEGMLHDRNIELQAAGAAKDEFLANMSHELRTPLNGIIGFAEFLVDGKPGILNSKQKEYLEDILTSGRRLLRMISDILDLTMAGIGKIELRPTQFSLRKAIEEACAVTRPLASEKNISIDLDVADELGEVTLDREKFKQVCYNLLSNAIKFNHEGGKVQIRAVPHEADGIKIIVSDTGVGIKAENIERIFNEFEQIDSGSSRQHDGPGLGLALTRTIADLQGGTIGVESELGKGSHFTVILPLVRTKAIRPGEKERS